MLKIFFFEITATIRSICQVVKSLNLYSVLPPLILVHIVTSLQLLLLFAVSSPSPHSIYRVVQKWHSFFWYALTSSNINIFLKLFHFQNQEKMCKCVFNCCNLSFGVVCFLFFVCLSVFCHFFHICFVMVPCGLVNK